MKHCQSLSIPIALFFILMLIGGLTACGSAEPGTMAVGIINLLPDLDSAVEGFEAGMAEIGYVEGEDVTYVYPGATGHPAALEGAAQDLMAAEVDLIFCVTTPACLAAQAATQGTDVAVVFSAVTDPVAAGLVADLSQPDGNATGITVGAQDAINEGRRLEWLLQVVPQTRRVYIPYNPEDAVATTSLATVEDVASTLEIELVLQEARTTDEVQAALDATPEDVDAMFVFADQVVVADVSAIVDTALERDLPLSTPNSLGPELGALMSYGSDLYAAGNQAARLADQILRGSNPDDLPVETPEFFLTLNLNTAEAIGLEIPDEVLRQADTIIR